MDYHTIQTLLDKYFEGLSSLEEEQQLKQFFSQEDIPEHLVAYQMLFQWQLKEKSLALPDDFEANLLQEIERQNPKGFFRRIWWHPMSRVAAVIVLAGGMWWAYQSDMDTQEKATSEINWEQYEPQSPEEAFNITRNAMIMISREFNKGTSRVAKEVVKMRQLGKVGGMGDEE